MGINDQDTGNQDMGEWPPNDRPPGNSAARDAGGRLSTAAVRPDPTRTADALAADARRSGRLGGGFRTMVISSVATLLVIMMLPLAMGLPAKFDPWSISSIANGDVNVTFLDSNGAHLAHRGYRQEETVPLAEMPSYLVEAVLAMEDRRFYRHWGVDVLGILRAARANFAANRIVEGGSTITQQLARNLYLDPSRDFGRKAQEAALAFWLEQRLSKDQILELYLNRIYLGAGAYGVEAASRVYFSKSVRDLTLSEAALIAGLPKAPAQLSPVNDLDLALERAALVLDKLEDTGVLPLADIELARATPAVIARQERAQDMRAAYFVDWVFSRLPMWIEGPPRELVVETTIDPDLQRMGEEALNTTLDDLPRGAQIDQGALVALDHTGAVKAMVGGRDYLESQFNRATQAVRQPGSAFKPLVYMAALQNGYTPYSGVVDRPITIDGWRPLNANLQYSGWMQMRNAVAWSVNTIAVRVADKVGFETVADFARASGITTPMPAHPSLALGAMGTKLFELTGAYVPYANGGYAAQAFGIARIRTVDGKILYERARKVIGAMPPPYREDNNGRERVAEGDAAKPVPLYEKLTTTADARTMTAMLKRVITIGTGRKATLGAREAAGKTGTTNDNRDALFVGYTADLVAGVWLGNDNNAEMGRVYGGTLPAQIWASFMTNAHEDKPLRSIYKRYWVMPHPSQQENESEEAEVPVVEAGPAGAALRIYLNRLASALSSAAPLAPTAAEVATTSRSRGMDRSVFRSRND
ncbi:PBP1A family penicillin-binding protein [Pyruvatibacter sp.]|uniref:transglycosylase domain-containing protein n=1 Tax=Pyruvatibacter sp. TaxID=1981328 RepID=UPI0032EF004C